MEQSTIKHLPFKVGSKDGKPVMELHRGNEVKMFLDKRNIALCSYGFFFGLSFLPQVLQISPEVLAMDMPQHLANHCEIERKFRP